MAQRTEVDMLGRQAKAVDCPFLVQEVLFNSLLSKADRDLAEIARILGEDPSSHEELAENTKSAVEEKLWDEDRGTYLDYVLVDGKPIHVYFGPNLAARCTLVSRTKIGQSAKSTPA